MLRPILVQSGCCAMVEQLLQSPRRRSRGVEREAERRKVRKSLALIFISPPAPFNDLLSVRLCAVHQHQFCRQLRRLHVGDPMETSVGAVVALFGLLGMHQNGVGPTMSPCVCCNIQ
jgi:hypothetical protein